LEAVEYGLTFDAFSFLEDQSEPWIAYNLARLRGEAAADLFQDLCTHPKVQWLVDQCVSWPHPPIFKVLDPGHPLHVLGVLADLGLNKGDEWIRALSTIIARDTEEGLPLALFGKGSKPIRGSRKGWAICVSAKLLHILTSFGGEVEEGLRSLIWLSQSNGWRCEGSGHLPCPGWREDYCPIATLNCLKALADSRYTNSEAVQRGIEAVINHWEEREVSKPHGFKITSQFEELRYPTMGFDILNVVDTLSRYKYAQGFEVFWELWNLIRLKQSSSGGFKAGRVYRFWGDWCFGQKSTESPWLTYKVLEIAKRLGLDSMTL